MYFLIVAAALYVYGEVDFPILDFTKIYVAPSGIITFENNLTISDDNIYELYGTIKNVSSIFYDS